MREPTDDEMFEAFEREVLGPAERAEGGRQEEIPHMVYGVDNEDGTTWGLTMWATEPSEEVEEGEFIKSLLAERARERHNAPDPSDSLTDDELWSLAPESFKPGGSR